MSALSKLFQDTANAIREKTGDTGTMKPADFPDKILSIEAGGTPAEKYVVTAVDYDGTVIAEVELNGGETYSLPTPPAHSRLVFEGWSAPVDVVNNTVTVVDYDIVVGAVYHTASGATEVDVELSDATGLEVAFDDVLTGRTSIDWGDGTVDNNLSHTYGSNGAYTIKIYGMTAVGGSMIIANSNVKSNGVKAVYFANTVTSLGSSCLNSYYAMQYVTLPTSVTNIANNAFNYSKLLKCFIIPASVTSSIGWFGYDGLNGAIYFVIPNSITSIDESSPSGLNAVKKFIIPDSVTNLTKYTHSGFHKAEYIRIPKNTANVKFTGSWELKKLVGNPTTLASRAFMECYSLENADLLLNATSIESEAFYDCIRLGDVVLGEKITKIASSAFTNCVSMRKFVALGNITQIGRYAFKGCVNCWEYDFTKCTQVPTLEDTTVFSGINKLTKIKAPASLYEQWIAATNWSNYATYIVAV